MSRICSLVLILATIGCKDDGFKNKPPIDTNLIKGVYEYKDTTNCTGASLFGDSPLACVRTAQVVVFLDGSIYYSLGVNWIWSASGYMAPGQHMVKRHGAEFGSTYFTYEVTIDLESDEPSLEVKFDSNGDLDDVPGKAFILSDDYYGI